VSILGSVVISSAPLAVERGFLRLGRFQPRDRTLAVTNCCLELDGKPWVPVMGEFHYSRYPRGEWEAELRKMRAGGVDIVASYVMWNHHEAEQGRFDWTGQRDLRHFVTLAHKVGLHFYLRPGPWVHAEVRHGGFPDWLVALHDLRSNDPVYLGHVRRFFGEIGRQLQGLMWCDGGPVIGVQLENEYDRTGRGCGAEHILELKRLAIDCGLMVPLYTVTGWPTLDIPPQDVIPVSGAYADGFWSGEAGVLPPSGVFQFNTSRAIGEMGNVSGSAALARIDKMHYPFFLAEAGGGMHVSYHRRPALSTDDVAATCLVQVGNGTTLYGYYMFHGGTNPDSPLGRLNESQDTGYPNDVPVKGYDFRAPLGQYGQVRESYGRLRTLHLFLASHGTQLAHMEPTLPAQAPADAADTRQLRMAARGHGESGFVFVNNHMRNHPMPVFRGRLSVTAGTSTHLIPSQDIEVPDGAYFIWPIGQQLGAAVMDYATVQPLTRIDGDGAQTWVGFAHPAIAPEIALRNDSLRSVAAPAEWIHPQGDSVLLRPDLVDGACRIDLIDRRAQPQRLLILSRDLAEQCARLHVAGRERLVISEHGAYVDEGGDLVVRLCDSRPARVLVYPCDDIEGTQRQGAFACFEVKRSQDEAHDVRFEMLRHHPEPPPQRMGPHVAWRKGPVPRAPDDEEFADATRVALHIASPVPATGERLLLAIDYIGDAARLYADDQLVDDHFHDGDPWFVGVDRYARDGEWPRLELRIVAADPGAPIFREPAAAARLVAAGGGARVQQITATLWSNARLTLAACSGMPANPQRGC
jgi:beta-galactosidase